MSDHLHVVQIGLDQDVFNEDAAQDSRQRQIAYSRYLKKYDQGIHLTNIILTADRTHQAEEMDEVSFIPCNFYRLRQVFSLAIFLKKFNKHNHILLVTTQDIHGVFWGALIFCRLAKIPIIGQVHYDLSSADAREELLVKSYGRLYEKSTLLLVRLYNGMRVVNTATKKYLESIHYNHSICVSPVPVLEHDEPVSSSMTTWKYPGALRVIFVGRFVQVKNLDFWLETAAKALLESDNIEFAMIGDGDEREHLETYCEELGLCDNVQFTGALTPEQLNHWYGSADVILLVSRHEGFGRVIVEAMNSEVVPVCVNRAGPSDIIEHGVSGYLEESDTKLLARRLVELEKNRDKLNSIGVNARDTVRKKFKPEILTKRWLDYLLSFVPLESTR